MDKTLRWTLIIVGIIVVAAALVWGGVLIARANTGGYAFGPNMMPGYSPNQSGFTQPNYGYAPGMMNGGRMGGGMMGGGMMGYAQNSSGSRPFGPGMMNGGMMGGYSGRLYGVNPISLDQAQQAIEDYVARLGNADLTVGEVMVFDNHAYAQIVEKSTGIGALEVLIDPVTLAVSPEPGPNMMWNQKYSPMGGFGGMMGGVQAPQASGQMPVSASEATQAAQRYLDTYLPGAQAASEADPFYGYYTVDILRDGKPAGMLSVNGYTRQVFVHTWHADFVEMSEE